MFTKKADKMRDDLNCELTRPDATYLKSLTAKLTPPPLKNNVRLFLDTRNSFNEHLFTLMTVLQKHMPEHKDTLHVLSLGCGCADEFLALRAYYDPKGIKIKFVGIDICQSDIEFGNEAYRNFQDSIRFIKANASQVETTLKALEENKCVPRKGFDLVFLRQPDITSPTRGDVFKRMINDVIPFCCARQGKLIFTCYHEAELDAVTKIANRHLRYHNLKGNQVYLPRTFEEAKIISYESSINAETFNWPDAHTGILVCNGMACGQRPAFGDEDEAVLFPAKAWSRMYSLDVTNHPALQMQQDLKNDPPKKKGPGA